METIRIELTPEEMDRMGKRAGALSRQIRMSSDELSLTIKAARADIKELEDEMIAILEDLRTGTREVAAQRDLFDVKTVDPRQALDECREVVRRARQPNADSNG